MDFHWLQVLPKDSFDDDVVRPQLLRGRTQLKDAFRSHTSSVQGVVHVSRA